MQQEAAVRQEGLQCVVNVLEGMLTWYQAATGQGYPPGADSVADAEEVMGQMAGVIRWVELTSAASALGDTVVTRRYAQEQDQEDAYMCV